MILEAAEVIFTYISLPLNVETSVELLEILILSVSHLQIARTACELDCYPGDDHFSPSYINRMQENPSP